MVRHLPHRGSLRNFPRHHGEVRCVPKHTRILLREFVGHFLSRHWVREERQLLFLAGLYPLESLGCPGLLWAGETFRVLTRATFSQTGRPAPGFFMQPFLTLSFCSMYAPFSSPRFLFTQVTSNYGGPGKKDVSQDAYPAAGVLYGGSGVPALFVRPMPRT